ncbi:amidase domain-containing protein [Mycetocola manganoxydans]|uniref:amidase domain-containing protein n=1 Tax=Mycetocola manganoxydans TaxID=699879 RepID=UPI0015FFDBB5|nr:amidase domain-containing protein [Mycetocola manganoxydans]
MPSSARKSASPRIWSRRMAAAVIVATSTLLWTGCSVTVAPSDSQPQASSTATPVPVAEVTAMSPTSGSVTGGTTLTLTGTGLADVTDVTIGGIPATDVTVTEDGTVTAVAPAALHYQPADAAVVVSSGDKVVEQSEPLNYAYSVITGVDAQMQYALKHWNDYNSNTWGNLNPVGGDCANFVSQTLIQRGWTQNETWFNKNAAATLSDWSPAWGYVPAMDNWLASDDSLGLTKLTLDQRDQVKLGDIAIFDWNLNDIPDHVMLVSSVKVVDGVTKITFASHNRDGDYRDLDDVLTIDHPGGNAWFWSIPA